MEKRKRLICLLLEEEEEDDDFVLLSTLDDRGDISSLFKKRRTEGTFKVLIKNHLKDNEQEFKEYFRLSNMQFYEVLNSIAPLIEKQPNSFVQQPISAYEKLALTLR